MLRDGLGIQKSGDRSQNILYSDSCILAFNVFRWRRLDRKLLSEVVVPVQI